MEGQHVSGGIGYIKSFQPKLVTHCYPFCFYDNW